MIPGMTSKLSRSVVASAAVINADSDIIELSGTTTIDTILPSAGGFSTIAFLIPVAGSITLSVSGNIAKTVVMVQNQVTVLIYSKGTGKWYPGAIS